MGALQSLRARWRAIPWTPVERALFLTCCTVVTALVAQAIATAIVQPPMGGRLAAVMLLELFMGREAAIPTGLASGVDPLIVFEYCVLQDLATGFIMYVLVAAAWASASSSPGRFGRALRRLRPAHPNRWAQKLGPLGLFLFMLVPFLVNGPLVAALAGRAAGMRTRSLILPICAATVVASAAWTFLTGGVLSYASHYGALAVVLVVVVLAAVAAVSAFLNRDRTRARAEAIHEVATPGPDAAELADGAADG